ncbi:MAG TPA: ATP-binding protein [Gammaproteobacteria bacterium]|nr:ATP-binding protein [Gammaproteobacteria bacterium]
MRKDTRSVIIRYAAAVAAVALVLSLWLSLGSWLGSESLFMLLVLAVLAASWYGGLGAGFLATLLAAALGSWLLIEPAGQLSENWSAIASFLVIGTIISIVNGTRHRTVLRTASREQQLGQEVADRERAEASLREGETRFRLMADHAPVLVWMSGTENRGTWFNRPWLEFVGRTMAQEIGTGWAENVHPEDVDKCGQTRSAAFDARQPFDMEFRLRRHDGAWRWVLDNGVPLYGADGAFTGYIGSCIDITERKVAEEALRQADQRKNDFLAALAHELRNPLAPIRNGLQILKAADDGRPAVSHTRQMMERQLQQMVRIIDDLLDVTRITQGELELRRERVGLLSIVRSAIETSQPVIEESGNELVVELPEQSGELDADPVRMAQVISNLLNNAAKYTPAGGRIRLAVETTNGSARIQVSDTGVGIPPEQLAHVFQMFYQGAGGPDRPQGGLGIGLTLASELVQLHGGSIEAHSPGTGLGSEFTVRVPMLAEEAELAPPGDAPAAEAAMHGSQRILVVDDNVDAAESLAMLLRLDGHDVATAHDGGEAVASTASYKPDIVLLDLGMPELDGYSAARQIRQQPGGRDILLIALTGWGQDDDRRRTKAAGFDAHVVKPVDPSSLTRTLAELYADVHHAVARAPGPTPRMETADAVTQEKDRDTSETSRQS